jgi:beta-glucosidase
MSSVRPLRIAEAGLLAVLLLFDISSTCMGQNERAIRSHREIDSMIDELLSRMTVEEKVGQITQAFHFGNSRPFDQRVIDGQIGSIADEFDTAQRERLQHLAVEQSRLHIPLLFGSDVIHGYKIMFPIPLAMAGSWDMSMIEDAQRRAAFEARMSGQFWTYAPMVDIARDPRWGRIVEGAGEDPYLGSMVAAAQVKGFQGDQPIDENHILATMKHFAGYGASLGGRDHDDVNLSESQLRNVYLKPFKAGVDAGVGSVMSGYIDLNDVPATGNHWLLTDILRNEWRFRGLVISDNNAVSDLLPHGFARDKEDASLQALRAGIDVSMSNGGTDFTPLVSAAKSGILSKPELDRAVQRVLRLKYELGLFDHPYVTPKSLSEESLQEDLRASRLAAERSAVLLKNDGPLLPLAPGKYRKLALIGELANSRQDIVGPWFAALDIERVTSIRTAFERSASFETIQYAQGVQFARTYPSPFDMLMKERPQKRWTKEQADNEFQHAIEVARGADLVIAVMGEMQNMSGESASRASLNLPGRQEELLQALSSLGKPIVLVLLNGRPLAIPWEAEHIPAILEMWYPGSEGGNALVDLLLGRANPSGKLTTTWPRDGNQIPIYYAHNATQDPQNQGRRYWDASSAPMFPFGFGLSYARFSFSSLKVNNPTATMGTSITVETEVENIGSLAGDTVVQLYVHQHFGSDSRPVRELKGFKRISLQPGEKEHVRFALSPEDLTYWSTAKRAWIQEPSTYDVWVGEDSTAKLSATFEITEQPSKKRESK